MTYQISSINQGKYYDGACLSLNRLRYRSDEVSDIIIDNDPNYWKCVDLFQDLFQSLENYHFNN